MTQPGQTIFGNTANLKYLSEVLENVKKTKQKSLYFTKLRFKSKSFYINLDKVHRF